MLVDPSFLERYVSDTSQVDAIGKQSTSVNLILGYLSNPVAGILDEPPIN